MVYRINYSKVISQAHATQAAESYEAAEREGTQKAQEQGKIF